MHLRILNILLLCICVQPILFSQINVAGKWTGTYTFHQHNYPQFLELMQDGTRLTGVVISERKDSTDFIKYSVEGEINGDEVILLGDEVLEKTNPLGCMPYLKLRLIQRDGFEWLEGHWKPYFHKNGCPIGVSGTISVVKQQPKTKPIITEKEEKNEANDVFTQEMIDGLKKRRYRALLICENEYDDPRINSLQNPIKDGQALKQVLIERYSFSEDLVQLLKNPTRAEILEAFEQLDTLNNYDNLLIFYAGHGVWKEDLEQGYWLPSDAKHDSKANWISNSTIRDYVRSMKTKHTLLISDACFSGGLLQQRSLGESLFNLYNLPSRKAITSGTLTTVPDKSVFMEYLLKYLESNEKPLLSADQLFFQTKLSVIQNSPNHQVPQYGPIHNANDEGGEFIFLKGN